MQVEKRVTGRYAKPRTVDNVLFTKITDGWLTYNGGAGWRIDAGDRFTKVHLPPSGLPSLQCIETVGQGYARFERVEDTGEVSS